MLYINLINNLLNTNLILLCYTLTYYQNQKTHSICYKVSAFMYVFFSILPNKFKTWCFITINAIETKKHCPYLHQKLRHTLPCEVLQPFSQLKDQAPYP